MIPNTELHEVIILLLGKTKTALHVDLEYLGLIRSSQSDEFAHEFSIYAIPWAYNITTLQVKLVCVLHWFIYTVSVSYRK